MSFNDWLQNHPQADTTETLWLLQNCLGAVLGFDHPDTLAAKHAWQLSRYQVLSPTQDEQL